MCISTCDWTNDIFVGFKVNQIELQYELDNNLNLVINFLVAYVNSTLHYLKRFDILNVYYIFFTI